MTAVAEPTPGDVIGAAIRAVPGLVLPRQTPTRWERRTTQTWYRVSTITRPGWPAHRMVVCAAVVVPIVDQMEGATGRPVEFGLIGGNLRSMDGERGAADDLVFDVVKSRAEALAGRLGDKVRTKVRYLIDGSEETMTELVGLFTRHLLPLMELTTWQQVESHLEANGATLAGRGLCAMSHQGQRGILRWAGGDEAGGLELIRAAHYEPAHEAAILARLRERFRSAPTDRSSSVR